MDSTLCGADVSKEDGRLDWRDLGGHLDRHQLRVHLLVLMHYTIEPSAADTSFVKTMRFWIQIPPAWKRRFVL